MVGLTQDEEALDRHMVVAPHVANIVQSYLQDFQHSKEARGRDEHYQLTGEVALLTYRNALKIRKIIEVRCKGNPFVNKMQLKCISSSSWISEHAKDDIINYAKKGQAEFEKFVDSTMHQTSERSVWDPMTKMKLKSFSNWMEKKKNKGEGR